MSSISRILVALPFATLLISPGCGADEALQIPGKHVRRTPEDVVERVRERFETGRDVPTKTEANARRFSEAMKDSLNSGKLTPGNRPKKPSSLSELSERYLEEARRKAGDGRSGSRSIP